MANEKNLIRLSPSEAREYGRRGGKASGKARRRKADFRKTLNMLLTAEIDSEEWKPVLEALGVECTLESALNMAMIKEGLAGNVKAYEAVARYAGQSSRTDTDLEEQAAKIQLMQAQKEKVKTADPESEGLERNSKDPHDVIIPELWDIFDDQDHEHQIVTSGRAGTKSSFAGILGISTIVSDEPAAPFGARGTAP